MKRNRIARAGLELAAIVASTLGGWHAADRIYSPSSANIDPGVDAFIAYKEKMETNAKTALSGAALATIGVIGSRIYNHKRKQKD
jgi:hypothetical protein